MKITLTKGETKNLQITVTDGDGAAVDLTGSTIDFAVRTSHADTTDLIALTGTEGGGAGDVTWDNPAGGIATLNIEPSDTASVDSGSYVHRLKLTLASGDVYYLDKDAFDIED